MIDKILIDSLKVFFYMSYL